MNRLLLLLFCLGFFFYSNAQVSLPNGSSTQVIDFDTSFPGVNANNFNGSGFEVTPSSGQLDADAWATTGLSDGAKNFGIANTSGDHARGNTSGGVGTGGLYGVDLGGGNKALGIQPTGSDWTPGTITLKIDNNSTAVIEDIDVDYNIYVRNDQNRSSSFNFSYSFDNVSFIDVTAASYISPQSASGPAWTVNARTIQLGSLSLDPNTSFYLRWSGSDVSGSGSRDEFALDDIVIFAEGATSNCTEPIAQASNLSFGTVTSNSIEGSFSGGTADKYLIVQSLSSSLGAVPSDGVVYNSGNTLGNGEVIQYGTNTSFNSLGLSENTSYYYFIYASNDICSGGPDYLLLNPLTGSTTTQQNTTNGYYSSIGNETCDALKTALHDLIDGHNVVSYGSLWTHYQTTDDHLNDGGNETIVWDMYSDNPNGSENEFTFVTEQCGSYQMEGDCYNREHTFPKSWWGGSTSVPQYTDIFVVIPVDGWINGVRNNNPYGEVQGGTETQITNNGCALGSSSINIPGYTASVFEPIDAYKGDLARGYFYMSTRYEDNIAAWENYTSESDAVLDGTAYPSFEPWFLDMLISWHNADPVDQKEIDRNEAIFNIQGNRNPFIDHPEYVSLIWNNCGGSDTEAPTSPTNLFANTTTETSTDLAWNSSSDNVAVTAYNVYQDGALVANVAGNAATVVGLVASTSYSFYVTAIDAAGNESAASNSVNITTPFTDTESPTVPTNLVASNVTENTADLDWNTSSDNVAVTAYRVYQDGSLLNTVAGNTYSVSGLVGATSYSFYVTAIDAAGNESAASNAVNITTLFTDTESPTVPTNLVASNITTNSTDLDWTASTDNIAVTGYHIYQDGVLTQSTNSNSTTISGLIESTTYSFYIRAYDDAGNESVSSATIDVTTDDVSGPVVLHEGYFENGWDNWIDGGSDCKRYSGAYSSEGNYSIRLRDNSNIASSMTSPSFDISIFDQVTVDFSFYPRSMENNEDFWLRYYDGNSWQTIATYASGVEFTNDIFYTVSVPIDNGAVNFPTNAQFRFQCDASGNGDKIFIDAVVITGIHSSGAARESVPMITEVMKAPTHSMDENEIPENESSIHTLDNIHSRTNTSIAIYPNPSSDFINIDLIDFEEEILRIDILDMMGRNIETIPIDGNKTLLQKDIRNLSNGIYLVRIWTGNDDIQLLRFSVKQ